MEDKKYTVSRIEYTQSELTWKQSNQLYRLYRNVLKIADGQDQVTLGEIMSLAVKYKVLDKLVDILVEPRRGFWYYWHISREVLRFPFTRKIRRFAIDQAPNSMIIQILEDCFFLNKRVKEILSSFGDVLGLMANIAKTIETEPSENGSQSTSRSKTFQSSEKTEKEPSVT